MNPTGQVEVSEGQKVKVVWVGEVMLPPSMDDTRWRFEWTLTEGMSGIFVPGRTLSYLNRKEIGNQKT